MSRTGNRVALRYLPLLLGSLLVAPLTLGATFTVNSIADAVDAVPGDGVCLTAGSVCTLRAATLEANAWTGTDAINLPAGTFTLALGGSDDISAVGDLDITESLTVTGVGATNSTIDGGGIDRVFDVHGGTVVFSDLTIRNGSSGNKGGGIRTFADLTANDCVVSGNTAVEGGGIHVEGPTAVLTLNSVLLELNSAGKGGGIRTTDAGSSATLNDVTFDRNVATGTGGGMAVEQGDATLIRVTFMDNDAGTGAGLWTKAATSDVSLTNVTISGNDATGEGGGIWAESNTLSLLNVTIANNTAITKGGGIRPKAGTVTFKHTIISGNSPDNCERAVTSGGFNIDSGATCSLPPGQSNIDPLLGPLQDNTGPTLTHALLAGSPAIDGVAAGCPPPATDQRNIARPTDGDGDTVAACDIGAYEAATAIVRTISGKIFEDVNYGGGIGRDLATAAADAPSFTVARGGATVELYSGSGNFIASTTSSAVDGSYSFAGVSPALHIVRVASATITSSRPGSDGNELGTQTYRIDGDGESINTGAKKVGGEFPSREDAAANSGAQTLASLQGTDLDSDGVTEWTQSVVTVDTTGGDVTGVDFGFNFDLIVNTNDAGQGSLRQFILNSNLLH